MDGSKHAWAWRRIHWQRPLDPETCLVLLRRLATDEPGVPLVFEVRGSNQVVTYLLGAPADQLSRVTTALSALMPQVVLTADALPRARVGAARNITLGSPHRALRSDDLLTSARVLLTALALAREGEEVVLQILLGPRKVPLAVANRSSASITAPWWQTAWQGTDQVLDGEKRNALREKVGDHGFASALRIGAASKSPNRAAALLRGLVSALRMHEAAGLRLRHGHISVEAFNQARVPFFAWPLRLNVREVLICTAWPVGDEILPGQPPAHPHRLPPPAGVSELGTHRRVVAESSAPGSMEKLTLSAADALHHTHVLGPTGVGKSVLLGRLIQQDIEAGRAVVVIEPKGDLIDDVLIRIPKARAADVVILDPSDQAPVGINPLQSPGSPPQVVADAILSVFKSLYTDSWGPRTQDILHAGLLTLARRPDASLVMLPLLLTNEGFRRSITQHLDDPFALEPFWAWYNSLSEGERASAIAPVMNKLRPWLYNSSLRAVLGQNQPDFHIRDVFTQRRILLVPLRNSVIGQEASRLLGSLLVAQLWQSVLSRGSVPQDQRHPVMVYIDEVQDYLRLPTDLGNALAQARGLGVGFTLAHQFLDQLPAEMRAGVLVNARSRICFQLTHNDAVIMSKGHGELTPDDFMALGRYEVYASLFAHGQSNAYAMGRTLAPSEPSSSITDLRQLSRERYGQSLDVVEAGLQALIDSPLTPNEMPTGRRRRTS